MQATTEYLNRVGISHRVVGEPMLFDVLFIDSDVNNYRYVLRADAERHARYNQAERASGIFKAAGKLYPLLALTVADINQTIDAIGKAADSLVD